MNNDSTCGTVQIHARYMLRDVLGPHISHIHIHKHIHIHIHMHIRIYMHIHILRIEK